MSDTVRQNCKCCEIEDDCIDGLCQCCNSYITQCTTNRIQNLEDVLRQILILNGDKDCDIKWLCSEALKENEQC